MKRNLLIGAVSAALLAGSGAVWAEKPAWAGGGKPDKHRDKDAAPGGKSQTAARFDDDFRRIVSDYYGQRARVGKCPPGLAKKQNGCLPPGQAKKWALGQPLPPGLDKSGLPDELLRRLPRPPANHRYVQVAGDILLIAVGSSMVVEAIEDIFR
ncbi:MAG: RcnB family protein [Pseudomonadota bacterium]